MPYIAFARRKKGTFLFDGSANPSAVTTDNTLLEEINKFGNSAEEDTHIQENIARGKKAMQTVVATYQDVPNAMNRPDVGTIDFV